MFDNVKKILRASVFGPGELVFDVKNVPSSNPLADLQDADIMEWLDTDVNTEVTHILTDTRIIVL